MSGAWSLHDESDSPEPKETTRLRFEGHGIVSHVSAMTLALGDESLYATKRASLGEDPLREDSDPEKLWERVRRSKKSIGLLLMDQSFFPGVSCCVYLRVRMYMYVCIQYVSLVCKG
jgi:endonuclease-8